MMVGCRDDFYGNGDCGDACCSDGGDGDCGDACRGVVMVDRVKILMTKITGSSTSASLAMMVGCKEERRGTERRKFIWFSIFFKP